MVNNQLSPLGSGDPLPPEKSDIAKQHARRLLCFYILHFDSFISLQAKMYEKEEVFSSDKSFTKTTP